MGKRRGKRQPRIKALKILDTQWDQAFLISYLPEFVQARIGSFSDPLLRIGDWTGVRGDLSSLTALVLNARMVDAFAMMNPAQMAALMPFVRFEKIPTEKAKELFPDLDDSEEIKFPSYYDPKLLLKDNRLSGYPESAGIGDVSISEKFIRPGTKGAGVEVNVTFKFDSVKTFVKNQNKGIKYLDLIPSGKMQARSGGTMDVAYNLVMTVGWAPPKDRGGELFVGAAGQNILYELEHAHRQFTMQYGGKHDLKVNQDGAVELSITYKPIALARTEQGKQAQAREDIFGSISGLNVKAANDRIEELKKQLKAATDEQNAIAKRMSKARKDHIADQRKMIEELLKANQSLKNLDMQMINVLFDLDNPPKWLPVTIGEEGTPHMEEAATQKKNLELKKKLKSDLKTKQDKYENAISTDKKAFDAKQTEIGTINGEIDKMKSWDNSILSDRYGSLVRDMFQDGKIHFVDITATEQKKYSGRNTSRAIKAQKAFKGILSQKLQEGGSKDIQPQQEEYNTKMAEDAVRKAAKAALEKRKSEKNARTAAIDASPLNALGSGGEGKVEDRRVYYFYFGDLMDRIMMNWYHYSKSDATSGDAKAERHKQESLILGDFYYNTKEPKSKPIRATSYHMGDFPISLRLFTKWFSETFIRRGKSYVSLPSFLSELAEGFFKGEPALAKVSRHQTGPMLNPSLPSQDWTMAYDTFSSGVQIARGANQIARGGFIDARSEDFKKLFKTNYTVSSDDKKYEYHLFGPVGENVPPVPSYTLYLGSGTSIIKSISFSKQQGGKALRAARIAAGGFGDHRLGFASQYDVDMELFGAPFIKPKQQFELNISTLGINTIKDDDEALDDMLPKLLRVSSVDHKFDGANLSTSIKCKPVGATAKVYYSDSGDEIADFSRPGVPTGGGSGKKKSNKKKPAPKKKGKQASAKACKDAGGTWKDSMPKGKKCQGGK